VSEPTRYDATWTLDRGVTHAGQLQLTGRGLALAPGEGEPCDVPFEHILAVHPAGEPNQLHAPFELLVELRDGRLLVVAVRGLGGGLDLHRRLTARIGG
jgi:hypothetical protein